MNNAKIFDPEAFQNMYVYQIWHFWRVAYVVRFSGKTFFFCFEKRSRFPRRPEKINKDFFILKALQI
jgi:hypothetical protein